MNITELNLNILIDILSYLHSNDIYSYIETCKCFYKIIEYIKKIDFQHNTIYRISKPSDLHISSSIQLIEWAKTHKNFSFTQRLARCVTQSDNFHILKYLRKNNCQFCPEMYCDAINNNNIEIIKWLKRKGIELNEYAFHEAAKNGNIHIMKLLKKYNCEYNSTTVKNAILYHNIEALKWLINNGCCLDNYSFYYAVETGNINIIEYIYDLSIHNLSFPWQFSNSCNIAAQKGYMNVLRWLRERQCPWNINTIYTAMRNKNYYIAKWAIENGCEINRELYTQLSSTIYINENININFID